MDSSVIVMIVMLAMPNGESSVSVKPMQSAETCRIEAQIEASDPYVSAVECSELTDGKLELTFRRGPERKIPEAVVERSTG
ncbi:MAG: hypothetical protein WBP38_08085 [Hyphomicrobium sp.]|jgi:hypothetical protein|nr:hypothetical protein [Hyphomicrobium sp.]